MRRSDRERIRWIVREALAEDIRGGDVTSVIFGPEEKGRARIVAKAPGVLSGMEAACEVFRQLDSSSRFRALMRDGQSFQPGCVLAEISAPLAVLFMGERTALNFLQRLCGVAALTRRMVEALGPDSGIGIYDTRKTTPLLRLLEKRAVADGGGHNHRFALDDMAMLKDNHIDAAGGITAAVERLRGAGFFARHPRLPLCIEARSVTEAAEAACCGANIVMLDNMSMEQMRRAARAIECAARDAERSVPHIEVSGNVSVARIKALRALPIDRISVGALTHSAPSIDLSMRFG
ncbi:MAG: carboxylating nicotinate-nucleotide diphosphorylase [bacterium]|nr:carboxylating nicotinate-nucleotide diphosphorylase [Candidatus Sumerlaeota bacterium]